MPYITREDGVHFVIPSYRDVLVAKKSAIQKEVVGLSQSYGEYITMQLKGPQQYEVAFSPDSGYLLGETVWHYFKRPMDMIYCEAVPNTSEAILVIVKGGSVYLDGSFPLESIPEELVIFLTQQNNFEIFIYGDVPISEKPADGKFSFDASSIKSFKVLEEPAFNNLPLLRSYQFQLVDAALKEQGIGVFPIKQLLMIAAAILVSFGMYYIIFAGQEEQVEQVEVNPYQGYVDAMQSPAPDQALHAFVDTIKALYTVPGWFISTMAYSDKQNSVDALMRSSGNSVEAMMQWSKDNDFLFSIKPIGVTVSKRVTLKKRPKPKQIYKADEVLANFIDNLSKVYPGNSISLGEEKKSGPYKTTKVTITVSGVTPMVLMLIADQLKGLPFKLQVITMAVANQTFSGSVELDLIGE